MIMSHDGAGEPIPERVTGQFAGAGVAPRYPCRGEVAERLKAALLKSAELQDSVGSNPTLSAIRSRAARRSPTG